MSNSNDLFFVELRGRVTNSNHMSAVPMAILQVSAVGIPAQIAKVVVGRISVPVTHFGALGTRTNERRRNQYMNTARDWILPTRNPQRRGKSIIPGAPRRHCSPRPESAAFRSTRIHDAFCIHAIKLAFLNEACASRQLIHWKIQAVFGASGCTTPFSVSQPAAAALAPFFIVAMTLSISIADSPTAAFSRSSLISRSADS